MLKYFGLVLFFVWLAENPSVGIPLATLTGFGVFFLFLYSFFTLKGEVKKEEKKETKKEESKAFLSFEEFAALPWVEQLSYARSLGITWKKFPKKVILHEMVKEVLK